MALLGLVQGIHPICLLPSHRGSSSVIIANLILGTLNLQPNGTISAAQLLEFFPVLFITFLASIYALLKIPALTNHIFSGSSGGSSAGILEGMKP